MEKMDFLDPNNDCGQSLLKLAAAGSSILMSWAPPMASQDEIVDILVESYPNQFMIQKLKN